MRSEELLPLLLLLLLLLLMMIMLQKVLGRVNFVQKESTDWLENLVFYFKILFLIYRDMLILLLFYIEFVKVGEVFVAAVRKRAFSTKQFC